LLVALARRHVRDASLTPPLALGELCRRAEAILASAKMGREFTDFVTVLVSNAAWRDQVAAVPYNRRLLLLPQCLRDAEHCQADIDSFGLVCRHCGRCVLDELLITAEGLGYTTLVAEGTIVATTLIQTNRIDAIVGVSCLASLEQVFPYLAAAACAGVAIPLLRDGCVNTAIDVDRVREAIHLLAEPGRSHRLDIEAVRAAVERWFAPDALAELLGAPTGAAERIAHDWLAGPGKRWRPFLAACTYQALAGGDIDRPDDDLRRVALAVECFHKASLIHDDIEDEDAIRYGRDTLHVKFGPAIALNVGDLLIGEGYRLLGELQAPPAVRADMLQAAANGHRDMCLGQGAELDWARRPGPVTPQEAIRIYELKTAPTFEVALRLAAILAGADAELFEALGEYCKALGVAYQIRDDLADADAQDGSGPPRPSLPFAVACRLARPNGLAGCGSVARRPETDGEVLDRCRQHFQLYRQRAIDSLKLLRNAALKGLLRRAIAKIFSEIPVEDNPLAPDGEHAGGRGAGAAGDR